MTPELRVVRLTSTDPLANLAAEEALFRSRDDARAVLLIWRNAPAVVIGRHQNPWRECDVAAIQRDGIPLLRRQSGGGTVYHDLGNANVSYMAHPDDYDQDRSFALIVSALKRLGINAHRTARNDIYVGDRKVSGNAFRFTRERNLHHGTLLINADLARLVAYLRPPEQTLEAKGIQSVPAKVCNLDEHHPGLDFPAVCDAIVAAARAEAATTEEQWPAGARAGDPLFDDARRRLAGWEWTYGSTPEFRRTVTGTVGETRATATVTVTHGRVRELVVTPTAANAGADTIAARFVGRRYGIDPTVATSAGDAVAGPPSAARDVVGWLERELGIDTSKGE